MTTEVVARLRPAQWDAVLEVFTTVERVTALRPAFRAWWSRRPAPGRRSASGSSRSRVENAGSSWPAGRPATARRPAAPDPRVGTVDRHVHGSLAMSETLAAARAGVVGRGAVRGTSPAPARASSRGSSRPRSPAARACSWPGVVVQRLLHAAVPARVQLAQHRGHRRPRPGGRLARCRRRAAARLPGVDGRGDGVREGHVVLASTNAPGSIDPADAASRFDAVIEMKAPPAPK